MAKNKKRKNARSKSHKTRLNEQSKLSKILSSVRKTASVERGYKKYVTVQLSPAEVSEKTRKAYFTKLTPSEVCSNVSKVTTNQHFIPAINLTTADNYERVYNQLTPDTDLMISLNWMIGLIIHKKDALNRFIELEESVTKLIFNESNDESIAMLDEMDEICGVSTWSLSVRFSVLKMAKKHSEAQEFLEGIYSKCGENEFFKFICRSMMNRYDSSGMLISSGPAFRNQVIRGFHDGLQNFLIYKVAPTDYSYDYKIKYEYILNDEKNSSIIDIFKAVLNLMSSSLDTEDPLLKEAAILAAEKLSPHFSYYVLNGLSAHYGVSTEWQHEEEEYKLIDSYSAGKYEEVCSTASQYSSDYFNFTVFELISKSAARTGKNPFDGLKGFLLENLIDVYLKKSDYQKSLSNILVICHAYSCVPWFQELHFLISRVSSYIDKKSHEHLTMLSSVYSQVNSPRKAETLPEKLRLAYFKSCNNAIKDSLSIRMFEIMHEERVESFDDEIFINLERNRLLKYKAMLLIKIGSTDEAIPLLEKLSSCSDFMIANEARRQLVDSYIDADHIEKAVESFVNAILINGSVVSDFNTDKICDVTKEIVNKSDSINLSIALSLHSRNVDSDFDYMLRYSFDKYLDSNNLDHPLDIKASNVDIDVLKINYFLEHVCTPHVMRLSLRFETKKDIEDCRIALCAYLIEKGVSKTVLVNEVKKITRDQVIRKAGTQVNQSRIHAEVDGFKDGRSQSYRNVFDRYSELNRNDYASFSDEITLSSLYEKMPTELLYMTAHVMYVLSLNLNEKNAIFYKLINILRDEFTYGQTGLNSYLSTRIRHGVLPNTLRSCVTKENLVTARQINTNNPISNEYWQECLPLLSTREWVFVEKALAKFTIDYEAIYTEVNDQWLQVVSLDQDIKKLQKGGSKDKALFDYSVTDIEAYVLQRALSKHCSYDEFIEVTTDWLWMRTETVLESVRNQISTTATDSLMKCYDVLSASVNIAVSDKTKIANLHDAISRSKDSLHITLKLVASWFTRVEVDVIKEFEFDTAIEIAARPASINIKYDEIYEGVLFEGKYLTSFVDILYIIFDNAAVKSHIQKDDLIVEVSLEMKPDGSLIICVTNNCKIDDSLEEENNKLDYYRNAYGNEILINKVIQDEGGTGIFKIWKILSKDIKVKHDMYFGYESKVQVHRILYLSHI